MNYHFSDKEIKILLKNIVICVDTREQRWEHIKQFFDKHKVKHKVMKLNQGDYSCYIESNEETIPIGVKKDWHFSNDIVIEKKNSCDELVASFIDRDRFEHELARFKVYNIKAILLVEDANGYHKLKSGDYRSNYNSKSAIGTLETFASRFDLDVQFIDKEDSGFKIFKTLYYYVNETLRNKGFMEEIE